MVYYDSKMDTLHDIGDLNILVAQQFLRVCPQSKIHSKLRRVRQ
jgi:hypothetical protein